MKTCLILIDAQESFRHRRYFNQRDFGAYVGAQNALIQGARAQGMAAPHRGNDVVDRLRP